MNEIEPRSNSISPAQWGIVALVVAFSAGSILYKLLMHVRFGHSSAMFIGVPAVLAILLALTPRAKSATGAIVKGITLALLIIAPLLGEGYLCILMAAPLFYIVGIVIGIAVDYGSKDRNATLGCVALVLLPMCLEGVFPAMTFRRAQTVEVSKLVNASPALVEQQLAQSPRTNTPLPFALRVGFPQPIQAWGDGLAIGALRTIHFTGAEGDPPGDLVMRVTERRDGYARFETISDGSKLTQWIRWNGSEVEWRSLDPNHTQVTWRIHFDRQLDPAWYFTPWERAVVGEAAKYLIDANAIPAGSR
jgi:hypothetical protein